jgi:hypothetical protein
VGPERSGVRFTIGRWRSTLTLLIISALPASAHAAPAGGAPGIPPAPPLNLAAPPPANEPPPPAEAEPAEEVTPPPPSNTSPLVITGYVDVGFAKAQGDGTSFPASYATAPPPGPADY